jgi:hypothetical protein
MPATDQEILAHHLVYEVEMLVSTLVRLEAGIRDDRVMAYAFIESFSLHARNLIEFFQLPRPDRDKAKPDGDKVGAYMFADESYRPMAKAVVKNALRAKLNNQIVHITRERTTDDSQKLNDIDRRELITILGAELVRFIASLAPQFKAALASVSIPTPAAPAPSLPSDLITTTNVSHGLNVSDGIQVAPYPLQPGPRKL